jgi:hypothetical protein
VLAAAAVIAVTVVTVEVNGGGDYFMAVLAIFNASD